ncbi:hypothetical protein ATANTOWER_027501 [Ataeniobius toweri]|uniref:Uncharacterized protein n=1 Tax=Ataeniobius toweri TaxID=208326 RepID=A0ABU7A931_9TELE|nr:hypothetical protein [Ataeniobius toweri]
MLLPSIFLHCGSVPQPIMTEGPSQETDRAEKLKQWIHQQDEKIKATYGEDIEIEPSPILLAEMEEVLGGSRLVLAPPGYKPNQLSSTFVSSAPVPFSSCRQHRHHLPSAAAVAARAIHASSSRCPSHPRQQQPLPEPSTPAAAAARAIHASSSRCPSHPRQQPSLKEPRHAAKPEGASIPSSRGVRGGTASDPGPADCLPDSKAADSTPDYRL